VAIQVSVVGSGTEREEHAETIGRLLAERGATVVTGGLGEVMAAAARGAKSAGGTTIGILPGETRGMGTSGSTTSSSRAWATPATSPSWRRETQ
jgi:uncharacterized protein (TIGR00725 family)